MQFTYIGLECARLDHVISILIAVCIAWLEPHALNASGTYSVARIYVSFIMLFYTSVMIMYLNVVDPGLSAVSSVMIKYVIRVSSITLTMLQAVVVLFSMLFFYVSVYVS